jgi:hypothetical protein
MMGEEYRGLRYVLWYIITDAGLSCRVGNCPWRRREKGSLYINIYLCMSDYTFPVHEAKHVCRQQTSM